MSCTSLTQTEKNKKSLICAVKECVESGGLSEKVIGVYKSHLNRGDYELYFIRQFEGLVVDEDFINEIIEWEGRYILLCSNVNTGISEEVESKFTKETVDEVNDLLFYFVQCRITGKSLLVKAVNRHVEPYEIPEIREFTCSENIFKKNNIEIIATSYSFDALENYVLEEDTLSFFPINYRAEFTIYNRSDSCLFFGSPCDSLGYFAIVNGNDTLYLGAKLAALSDYRIDDPDYIEDPEKFVRFSVTSEGNTDFFSRIEPRNYHQNLLNLLRDSIFYIPYPFHAGYVNSNCIYPSKKIKVITPIEIVYTFSTPFHSYYCINGSLIFAEDRLL